MDIIILCRNIQDDDRLVSYGAGQYLHEEGQVHTLVPLPIPFNEIK